MSLPYGGRLVLVKAELAVVIAGNHGMGANLLLEDFFCQRVLQVLLYGSFQRAGAHGGTAALAA